MADRRSADPLRIQENAQEQGQNRRGTGDDSEEAVEWSAMSREGRRVFPAPPARRQNTSAESGSTGETEG